MLLNIKDLKVGVFNVGVYLHELAITHVKCSEVNEGGVLTIENK